MSIDNELDMIKNNPYMETMRDAIHDGIKKGYDKSVTAENYAAEVKDTYDNILLQWDSDPNKDPELVTARDGETTLNDRLDRDKTEYAEELISINTKIENNEQENQNTFDAVTAQLAQKADEDEIIAARDGEANLKTRLDKENQEVTAQLAQKAYQADLEVERQRVNSLSSLTEGSTTGDAELQDIRIGVDGVEYQSAGDSVRSQLQNIDKAFGRRFITPQFISGFLIHSSGEERPSEPYQISEPLLLKKGETLVTAAGGTENVITILSRPNEFSELNDVIQSSVNNNSFEYSYTAPSSEYIVICSRITDYQYTYIVDTNKKANNNSDILSTLVESVDVSVDKEQGYYFHAEGITSTNAGYFKTDVISLEPNEIISFFARGTGTAVSILSEVDDDGQFIRPLILSEDSNPKLFSYGTNQKMNVVISCGIDVPFYIEKLKIKDVFFPETPTKDTDDYTPLFDNAVFIGDSITEGFFGNYPSGERVRDFSYPKAIGRLTEWSIDNLGISGANPTSWWDRNSETDFSTYDVAFLMFGRNESFENPEDEVNYKNIIAKLKDDNPNITIFILSLAPAVNNNEVPLNAIIEQIATDTDLPYLDIFTDSKMDYTKGELYRPGDGVHYNKLGYNILANDVLREMNNYIELNPNEFKDLFVPIRP